MATNFPTQLDTFTDVTSTSAIPSSAWNRVLDAVTAIETKLGVTGSSVETSVEYKLTRLATDLTDLQSDITALQSRLSSASYILRHSRLTLVGVSSTQATATLTSVSNGDSLGSTVIYAGCSGSYTVPSRSRTMTLTVSTSVLASKQRASNIYAYCDSHVSVSGVSIVWGERNVIRFFPTLTVSDFFTNLNGKTLAIEIIYE